MSTDIRTRALKLYRPPFRHEHGYIFDSNNKMVADRANLNEIFLRVRGWGLIGYLPDPDQLQDAVDGLLKEALHVISGDEVAAILTEFWRNELERLSKEES